MGLVEKMTLKNYFEAKRLKKQAEQESFLHERKGCCPLCERECSDEIESYVRKEIIKVANDPNYIPVVHGTEKKD